MKRNHYHVVRRGAAYRAANFAGGGMKAQNLFGGEKSLLEIRDWCRFVGARLECRGFEVYIVWRKDSD